MISGTRYVNGMPERSWPADHADILDLLASAEPVQAAILAAGSNYVYLLTLRDASAGDGYAVYKPKHGEAPLSDFPEGTLYKREYASYLVSEALGWGLVPPTIIRQAALQPGVGALQLFIVHDPAQHYFTLRQDHAEEMKRVAVFDWLTNNADRKGGHCLLAPDHRIWCIDQGLTFHEDDKLRTVIWDFQGQPVPARLAGEVAEFGNQLREDENLHSQLMELISEAEFAALARRAEIIGRNGIFPQPPVSRPYPWPMI